MNKKGFFVTLASILILVVVAFMLYISSEQSRSISEVKVSYLKSKMLVDYINDVEDTYLPTMIAESEKFAMAGIADYIYHHPAEAGNLEQKLGYVVMTGRINPALPATKVIEDNQTLPFIINRTFVTVSTPIDTMTVDLDVTSIRHIDSWSIEINSTVDLTVLSGNITWLNVLNYSNELMLYGFANPVVSGELISADWEENVSQPCFLSILDGFIPCDGLAGLCKPLPDGCS